MVDVPEGSLYLWCYTMGRRGVEFRELVKSVAAAGRGLRRKDEENYWRGWYFWVGLPTFKLYTEDAPIKQSLTHYSDYPVHPFIGRPEIERRWIPCNKDNRPLYKWGERGGMERIDAMCMTHCSMLAENMLGTQMIVIDCDGDHDEDLDFQTIEFFSKYRNITHTLSKPKNISDYGELPASMQDGPASFHLTFKVDKVIPTMHFPAAHVDIVGNLRNSLRFWKNKEWNGVEPAQMTDEIWEDISEYLRDRTERRRR